MSDSAMAAGHMPLGIKIFAVVAAGGLLLALAVWWLLPAAEPTALAIAETKQVGDLRITLQIDQAIPGERVIDVLLQGPAGPIADARAVRLRFSMAEMDMGKIEVTAEPVGDGHFRARGQFFSMAGRWSVEIAIERSDRSTVLTTYDLQIALLGAATPLVNPLDPDPQALLAGKQLYLANCVPCHGEQGRGNGPASAGLNPRPSDFTLHMQPGQHSDEQIYRWIQDGFPNSAMPAWKDRLTETEIWQLIHYLRTFGQLSTTPVTGSPTGTVQLDPDLEPLPPLVFSRQGDLWQSDGSSAAPRQLTELAAGQSAQYPSVSPDSQQIAFVVVTQAPENAGEPLPTSALYIMSLDGTEPSVLWELPRGLLGITRWAPDGQSVYVTVNDLQYNPDMTISTRSSSVVRVDLATGLPQTVVKDAQDLTISPDGKRIVYLRLNPTDGLPMSVYSANADGSDSAILIDGVLFESFHTPLFSPDGTYIIVSASGGPATDEQGFPIGPQTPTPLSLLRQLFEAQPASAHGGIWELWRVDLDRSGLRRLTNFAEDDPLVAFSTDGKQVVVTGKQGLYMMNADGSQFRRISSMNAPGGLDWVPR